MASVFSKFSRVHSRPAVAVVSARPDNQSAALGNALTATKNERALIQEDGNDAANLDDDVANLDMAADMIISTLEQQALGDAQITAPSPKAPRPPPPAKPPAMPIRATAEDLLASQEPSTSQGMDEDQREDTLAISSDVRWDFVNESQTNQQESQTENEETVARGRNIQALALLRERQQQDYRARHDVSVTDGQTAEDRIQAARAKAVKAAQEQARKQQEYAQVASREAARQKQLREKARQEYEAAEARRAEDLAKRMAIEEELRKERLEERKRAQEALRKAEEEAAAKAAIEEEERKVAAQAAAEAEARAAREERQALLKQMRIFVIRANGQAAASNARPGLVTDGPVTLPAKVELATEVRNVLLGELGPVTRGAASLDDAQVMSRMPRFQDLSISVGGELASLFRQSSREAFMTQHVTGKGPLTMMDQIELQHWLNQACMLVQAAATASLRSSTTVLGESSSEKPITSSFEMKLERGVLPAGHEQHASALLSQRIIDVQENGSDAKDRLISFLDQLVEEESAWVTTGMKRFADQVAGLEYVVDISVAAHVVSRASLLQASEHVDPAKPSNIVNQMVGEWISGRLRQAPPDGLLDVAEMSCWALGDDHPVAKFVLTLAEDNMSNARKQAVVERQRALDSLMAERLLEEERKSARELSDEQALEKEALTPVPERVWALRNIAATMALGDRSSRKKARELYSKAVELQQEFFGCENHPCLLGELWRLAELLQAEDEWRPDAVVLWEQCLGIIEAVIARYRGQGDLVSATVLAEGTCSALESILGPGHPKIKGMITAADTLFSALDDPDREQVIAQRGNAEIVDNLIKQFTPALRPYEVISGNKNIELWEAGHVKPLT